MSNTNKPEIFFFTEGMNYTPKEIDKRKSIVKYILKEEGKQFNTVNVVFCSNEKITELNKEYLKRNYATDVITFHYDEEEIGEIYIGIEQVKINSNEYKEEIENEISRVLIHGVLHLSGYKDYDEKEKKEMRIKENDYMSKTNN